MLDAYFRHRITYSASLIGTTEPELSCGQSADPCASMIVGPGVVRSPNQRMSAEVNTSTTAAPASHRDHEDDDPTCRSGSLPRP